MFSLAVTAFSTFSIMLQGFGLGRFVPPLGVGAVIGLVTHAYLFSEGGVWNQVARDRSDMSTNYSGPTMKMDDTLIGVAVFAAVNGRKPDKDEVEMIEDAVDEPWQNYRNGVALDDD